MLRLLAAVPLVAGSTVRAYLETAAAVTRDLLR